MTHCDGGCNKCFHWKCIRERMGREQLSVAMRNKGLWVCDVCKEGKGMEEAATRTANVSLVGSSSGSRSSSSGSSGGGHAASSAAVLSVPGPAMAASKEEIEAYRRRLISELVGRFNRLEEGGMRANIQRLLKAVVWKHHAVEFLIRRGAVARLNDVFGCVNLMLYIAEDLP